MKSKTSAEMGDAPLLNSRTSPAVVEQGWQGSYGLYCRSELAGQVVTWARNSWLLALQTLQGGASPPTRALIFEKTRRSQKGPSRPPLMSPRANAACNGVVRESQHEGQQSLLACHLCIMHCTVLAAVPWSSSEPSPAAHLPACIDRRC